MDRPSGRSVTSKVVAIFDAFGPDAPVLTLNELGARTGLPLSTVHRLATELVAWGGLERCDSAGYRIGCGSSARSRPAGSPCVTSRCPRRAVSVTATTRRAGHR